MIIRFIKVVGLAVVALTAAVACAQNVHPFEDEIVAFEKQDAQRFPAKGGVVFVGSSSIRLWKTVADDFPRVRTLNRGFGGSQASDSVYYADRIVTPYAPSTVVFFAGTNDLAAGKSPETVFADFKAFVGKVHAKLPNTRILFVSITPAPSRQALWPKMRRANALIKRFAGPAKNVRFVDVYDQMLTKAKGPRPELFVEDQLHMKPAGYAIWVHTLRPLLAREEGR